MKTPHIAESIISAIHKANAIFDDYNGTMLKEMLKRVQHGHRLSSADEQYIEAYHERIADLLARGKV
jgi:ribosome assembly protein YihI (activator of Der GTPase)